VRRVPLDFEISSTGFSFAALRELARLAREADVVHYHFPWPFMDLAHFIARVKKPTVVTYHSDIVRQKQLLRLYQPLKHRFLQSVDTIVATSPNYLASSAVLDRYRDKTRTITYGLDKSSIPRRTRRAWTSGARRWVTSSSCSSACCATTRACTSCSTRWPAATIRW
jgi:glycosyltransferase involved in cell wall biosynthesis